MKEKSGNGSVWGKSSFVLSRKRRGNKVKCPVDETEMVAMVRDFDGGMEEWDSNKHNPRDIDIWACPAPNCGYKIEL